MERKGLLGNLFFITIIIIIVILIAGTGFYFKYKSGSLEFGAGNVVVNINNGGNETPQKNETGVNEEIPAIYIGYCRAFWLSFADSLLKIRANIFRKT